MLLSLLYRHLFMRLVSLRLAFTLAGGNRRPFYTIRNMVIVLDFLLSYGIRLLVVVALLSAWLLRGHISMWASGGLLTLLVVSFVLVRQEKQAWRWSQLRPFFCVDDINVGSAKILRDLILIGHYFLNSPVGVWTQIETEEVLEKARAASRWIEGQAECYRVPLEIAHWTVAHDGIVFDKSIPDCRNRYQFQKELETALGSARQSVSNRAQLQKADNFCLMVHVYDKVRSYAVPRYIGRQHADEDMTEYCVCSKEDSAADYAHEILHLFGADDYYAEHHKALQRCRTDFLKGSIMFASRSLDRARVDELTAQNIGWL